MPPSHGIKSVFYLLGDYLGMRIKPQDNEDKLTKVVKMIQKYMDDNPHEPRIEPNPSYTELGVFGLIEQQQRLMCEINKSW